MADKYVISSRVEQIDKHLDKISGYKRISYEEFLNDSIIQDVVEYNLFRIVNHTIDIIEHIVVDEDYGIPSSSYERHKSFRKRGLLIKEIWIC